MSITRKEASMIKATINKNMTKRNAFEMAGGHKIAGGKCQESPVVHGIVLNRYTTLLGSGTCDEWTLNRTNNNVFSFSKEKEVA